MSTRPTPQQWLRENPGKNLHDYFLAYPEPKNQPQPSPFDKELTPEERKQARIGLFWLVAVSALCAAGLWFSPRWSAPYMAGGAAVMLYLFSKKEEVLHRLLGKSEASVFFVEAMRLAIIPLFVASLFKLGFMVSFPKTMVILFNGGATERSITFDGEQKTMQPAEVWTIECRDGNHKLLNPKTNSIEKMDLQPGFHAFSYGTDTKLRVVEIEYKSMTSMEKIERDVFGGLLSYRPKFPATVSGHYSVLHEMHNHVYQPGQRPSESVSHQKGSNHRYFKLETSEK